MFSCKSDNSIRGALDGTWYSDKYDVEIIGTYGLLIKLNYMGNINGAVPQVGDTVIKNLMKTDFKAQNFVGERIFLQAETNAIDRKTASFLLQTDKNTGRPFIVSITAANVDTIIFVR